MKIPFILLISGLILFTSCDKPHQATVFKDVSFFDGEEYFTHVNLILDSNIISDISNDQDWPAGSKVILCSGKTIIAPLLNAHVHVWDKNNLQEALKAGVFGLLDMHTSDYMARNLRKCRN